MRMCVYVCARTTVYVCLQRVRAQPMSHVTCVCVCAPPGVDAGTSRSLFVSVCKNSVKSVCVDGVPLSLLRHLHATAEESTQ